MSISPDKEKAVETAMVQIERQFGKGAIMKLGGRMISGIDGCMFFGISNTARILPFLQQGHSVISMPVNLNIISSIDCLIILSPSADRPKNFRMFLILSVLWRFDRNPK